MVKHGKYDPPFHTKNSQAQKGCKSGPMFSHFAVESGPVWDHTETFGPWLWDPGSFKVFPLGGLINRFFKKKKNMSSNGNLPPKLATKNPSSTTNWQPQNPLQRSSFLELLETETPIIEPRRFLLLVFWGSFFHSKTGRVLGINAVFGTKELTEPTI